MAQGGLRWYGSWSVRRHVGPMAMALLLLALFAGCSRSHRPAPVEDRSWKNSQPDRIHHSAKPRHHARAKRSRIIPGPSHTHQPPAYVTVRKGETLYSICFRYQLDLKQVARWNRIRPPYTIYPGQKLRLRGDVKTTARKPAKKTAKKAQTQPKQGKRTADVVVQSEQPKKQKPAAPSKAKKAGQTGVAGASARPAVALKNPKRWMWPVKGPVLSSYAPSDPARKGIVIAGRPGQPVKAAADGVVVYTGNALKAYGQLVIIKHSDTYLSAYGYNRRSLVKEGQTVRQGQTIAEMGTSPSGKVGLRFEIRKHGQPVNPANYLPKR